MKELIQITVSRVAPVAKMRRGSKSECGPGWDLHDDHGNSNGSHVKIFLPKKLLECLPKCSSLPKERHRWNTNE
ncbi:PREDICTED: calmodulin-binding transcription activator 1-like, partial [Eurypyga helias]|uniref:calmodulin-binding transcription activator 1-like n=1 Tax=Eurypyga helias TaxID=54383 RepID=UPI000528F3BD